MNIVAGLLGQQKSCRQAGNTSTNHWSDHYPEVAWKKAYPMMIMFLDITVEYADGMRQDDNLQKAVLLSRFAGALGFAFNVAVEQP